MKLVDELKHFKVIQCRCGFISVNTCRELFKCRLCSVSSRVVRKSKGLMLTHFGVKVLFSSDCEREASEFVRRLNEDINKDDVRGDFHSYKFRGGFDGK